MVQYKTKTRLKEHSKAELTSEFIIILKRKGNGKKEGKFQEKDEDFSECTSLFD